MPYRQRISFGNILDLPRASAWPQKLQSSLLLALLQKGAPALRNQRSETGLGKLIQTAADKLLWGTPNSFAAPELASRYLRSSSVIRIEANGWSMITRKSEASCLGPFSVSHAVDRDGMAIEVAAESLFALSLQGPKPWKTVTEFNVTIPKDLGTSSVTTFGRVTLCQHSRLPEPWGTAHKQSARSSC